MASERTLEQIVADSKAKTRRKVNQRKYTVSMDDIAEKGIIGALTRSDIAAKKFRKALTSAANQLADNIGTYEHEIEEALEERILATFSKGTKEVDANYIFQVLKWVQADVATKCAEWNAKLQFATEDNISPIAYSTTPEAYKPARLKTTNEDVEVCLQEVQDSKAISQPTKDKVVSLITTGHLPADTNYKSINKLTNRLEAKQINSLYSPQQLATRRAMNNLDAILGLHRAEGLTEALVQLITHRESANIVSVCMARQINQDVTIAELVALNENAITQDFMTTVAEVRDELAQSLANGQVFEFRAA